MKLLFVSNYYPPASRGGYEMWCQENAHALAARGHDVHVLTSLPGPARRAGCVEEHRLFELDVTGGLVSTALRLATRKSREERDIAAVRALLGRIQIDAALVWGMWNVPDGILATVESFVPGRTAYFFSDYWPLLPSAFEQQLGNPPKRGWAKFPKKALGTLLLPSLRRRPRPVLRFDHAMCCSAAVRDTLLAGQVALPSVEIVHGGIDVEAKGYSATTNGVDQGNFRLLYLGRLTKEKGLETAIEAVARLRRTRKLSLDVFGKGDPSYEAYLHRYTQKQGLTSEIRFRGHAPHESVAGLFGNYDALVFPSEWDEPFARTVLEAMAAGLPVIGTTTGGTGEILEHGQTGLEFAAGDPQGLAECVLALAADQSLRHRLAANAHRRVLERHTLAHMADSIEASLVALGTRNNECRSEQKGTMTVAR